MNDPLVSVFMITYNHEPYIAQALDSILIQQVDFTYEIVVGEDCSSDRTRTILIDYAQKHPDKFHVLLHDQNIGAVNNQNEVLRNCKGKYIAMCEGDDYWTDPLKLQKQVDFLEANQNYSMCLHNSMILKRNGKRDIILKNFHNNQTYYTEDIVRANPRSTITNSVVFRREFLNLPHWFSFVQQGDLALMLVLSLAGPIYYFSDVMGVYRKHLTSLGATSSAVRTDLYKRDLFSYFDYYTDFKFHTLILERKEIYQKHLYYQYLKTTGKFRKYFNYDYYTFKFKYFMSKVSGTHATT